MHSRRGCRRRAAAPPPAPRLRAAPALLGLACACAGPDPRTSGPHESERGLVTYWRVESTSASTLRCTDAPEWADVVAPPDVVAGSHLIYRVSADGRTAVGQSCATTDASTCHDIDQVYAISEHKLVYEPAPSVVAREGECELLRKVVWTIVDQGERGRFVVEYSFGSRPAPDSCQFLDAAIKDDSPNRFGALACLVQVDAQLAFLGAEAPPAGGK
ncbi:MAG: hypothetical protein HY744_23065 [Deltaproteobacteria bacterium]|nr:hypothetical protein [Deltaproteobacteria bacterium]